MYWRMLIGTAIVALLVHSWARIEPGLGIAVPIFLPPLIAAGVGPLLALRRPPPPAAVARPWGPPALAPPPNPSQDAPLGAPAHPTAGPATPSPGVVAPALTPAP